MSKKEQNIANSTSAAIWQLCVMTKKAKNTKESMEKRLHTVLE